MSTLLEKVTSMSDRLSYTAVITIRWILRLNQLNVTLLETKTGSCVLLREQITRDKILQTADSIFS
jgi:DNA gyrase inhibitor GyrI